MRFGDVVPETGGNVGSNFSSTAKTIWQLSLAPLSITRSDGKVTIPNLAATIDGPAGTARSISGATDGLKRWDLVLGDAAAEPGDGSGSDFAINRYGDAGGREAGDRTPLIISRATGLVTIPALDATLDMGRI